MSLRIIHEYPGFMMGYWRTLVQFAYMDDRITLEGFEAYLRALAEEIDSPVRPPRLCIYYRGVASEAMLSSARRKRIAEVLEGRRDTLKRTTAGFVLNSESAFNRAVLTAILWVAPPPYPYKVVGDTESAMQFFATNSPAIEPEEAGRACDEAWARFKGARVSSVA